MAPTVTHFGCLAIRIICSISGHMTMILGVVFFAGFQYLLSVSGKKHTFDKMDSFNSNGIVTMTTGLI